MRTANSREVHDVDCKPTRVARWERPMQRERKTGDNPPRMCRKPRNAAIARRSQYVSRPQLAGCLVVATCTAGLATRNGEEVIAADRPNVVGSDA